MLQWIFSPWSYSCVQLITKPSSKIIIYHWFVQQTNGKKKKQKKGKNPLEHCRWSKCLLVDLSAKWLVSFESHIHSSGPLGCSKPYRYGPYWAHVRHGELQLSSLFFPLSAEKMAGCSRKLLSLSFFCMVKGFSDSHPVPFIIPLPLGLAREW